MSNATKFRMNRNSVLLALISAAFAGQAQAAAGRVEFAVGGATLQSAGGDQRPVTRGAEVNSGDVVRTTNGRVHGDIAGSASDEEEAEEEGVHGRHWKRRARKTVDLVLGSGGPLLRIRTTNGGVHVNQE